jgi:hypothetical protein
MFSPNEMSIGTSKSFVRPISIPISYRTRFMPVIRAETFNRDKLEPKNYVNIVSE